MMVTAIPTFYVTQSALTVGFSDEGQAQGQTSCLNLSLDKAM